MEHGHVISGGHRRLKYYDLHETIYRDLLNVPDQSWDAFNGATSSFDDFCLRPFLEEVLSTCPPSGGSTALEIGCGTGPVCCFLAARGFLTHGIDVSPSAIAMARRNAMARALQIRFDTADICDFPVDRHTYDLVVDGHCLHCLVDDRDRQRALATVCGLLAPDGMFLVETMTQCESMTFGNHFLYSPDGMLHVQVDGHEPFVDAEIRNDSWYLPHRRILSTGALVAELGAAGLAVAWSRVKTQEPGEPHLFQACCVRS